VNDDVEEANYLNKAVYYQLAIVDQLVEVNQMEMFISATTFEMHAYGDCCTNYKKRIGLETASRQDLFVLRNVVSIQAYSVFELGIHCIHIEVHVALPERGYVC
jgi:hypothetical protein